MKIQYSELLKSYEMGLHEQLRNFTTGHDFLETWVPDEDPNRSIAGIFEAAAIAKRETALVLVVEKSTADQINYDQLKRETAAFGTFEWESQERQHTISFSFSETLSDELVIELKEKVPSRPLETRPLKQTAAAPVSGAIHPCYLEALSATIPLEHEGKCETSPPLEHFESTSSGVTLSVLVDNRGKVREARHSGTIALETTLLETFCQVIEGLPLQEAAEHGALRLEQKLRAPGMPLPVAGILTPDNADPIFKVPNQLIREIFLARVEKTGVVPQKNFWSEPIPKSWLALFLEQKISAISSVVKQRLEAHGLPLDALTVYELKNETRLTLDENQKVVGSFLLELERELHARLGVQVEVLLAERQDKNKPREKATKPKDAAANEASPLPPEAKGV